MEHFNNNTNLNFNITDEKYNNILKRCETFCYEEFIARSFTELCKTSVIKLSGRIRST